MVFSSSSSAQTVFTNADATDSLISNPGNWSAGLPTNGVTGTIGFDAEYDSGVNFAGFNVVHTNGTLKKKTGINVFTLSAGATWEMNGSSVILKGRGVSVTDATFTLNQGTADLTENDRDSSINAGSEIIINGGTMDIGRHFYVAVGDLTVNDGSLINIQDLGARNYHSGGDANLNGGAITATYLTFGTGGFDVNFGGTTAGSLSITNFGGSRANVNHIDIDFKPGTLMVMHLTDPVESGATGDGDLGWSDVGSETGLPWAEALWADGRLTYNGQSSSDLGKDWAAVTATGGLDGTYRFAFDGKTLALSAEGAPVETGDGTVILLQ